MIWICVRLSSSTPPKLKYVRIQSKGDRQGREYQTRLVSDKPLSPREGEPPQLKTSKTTVKKRTLELELRLSRTRLGSEISELVECRGLNEA